MALPSIVAQADWSCHPGKRWISVARRCGSSYSIDAPRPAGALPTLLTDLQKAAGDGPVLIGFDFPIGVPWVYAKKAGISDFRTLLPRLGRGKWSSFYDLAEHAADISVSRPFYPARPGQSRHAHLTDGLGVTCIRDLLRACDLETAGRGAACPIFWTLGGKQVGRAAITGWRDLLAPAIAQRGTTLGLWPFDGPLATLLGSKEVVIVEAYPAEACLHVGLKAPGRGWSKRNQLDRMRQAAGLRSYGRNLRVRFTKSLDDALSDGFGSASDGEDRFDAAVGILSMLAVVLGTRDDGVPDDLRVRTVEGWIFGQLPGPTAAVSPPP